MEVSLKQFREANSLIPVIDEMVEKNEVDEALKFCKSLTTFHADDAMILDGFTRVLLERGRMKDALELGTELKSRRVVITVIDCQWDKGDKQAAFQAADHLPGPTDYYVEVLTKKVCEEEMEETETQFQVREEALNTAIKLAGMLTNKGHRNTAYDAVCEQLLVRFDYETALNRFKELPAEEDSKNEWGHLRWLVTQGRMSEALRRLKL